MILAPRFYLPITIAHPAKQLLCVNCIIIIAIHRTRSRLHYNSYATPSTVEHLWIQWRARVWFRDIQSHNGGIIIKWLTDWLSLPTTIQTQWAIMHHHHRTTDRINRGTRASYDDLIPDYNLSFHLRLTGQYSLHSVLIIGSHYSTPSINLPWSWRTITIYHLTII